MYSLNPQHVFAAAQLLDDDRARGRIERVLGCCGRTLEDLQLITPETIGETINTLRGIVRPVPRERALVFVQQKTNDEEPDWEALQGKCPEGTSIEEIKSLSGHAKGAHRRERESDQERDHVCWCAWEFNTIWGCSHGCQYCGTGRQGDRVILGANLEEYAETVVRQTVEANPWQKCFRLLGSAADQITFEPEYGAYEAVAKVLADYPDLYLITHTASDNVYWLKDFPYRDRLIHVYSLTSNEFAAALEPDTPTPAERISAAAYVESLGIPSRPKLKPVIPTVNWREEYAATIKDLFARTRPESVGMAVMMWMDWSAAKGFLAEGTLDPAYAAAAEAAQEELRGVSTGPFPPSVRAEIYRFLVSEIRRWDKDVPVYVSTENRAMWEDLELDLGQSRRAFVCGCGPMAMPGGKLQLCPEMRFTTYENTDN